MIMRIKVLFFDLFFTLVEPRYNKFKNENDVLCISQSEWEKYAEDEELYIKRASGMEKNPQKIIEDIILKMRMTVDIAKIKEILKLREQRFLDALINVDPVILNVLNEIKKYGTKLCVVSNADVIDVMHWNRSPLKPIFDNQVFSYEVGYLKPQKEIYLEALFRMGVSPDKCIFIGDGGSDELKGAKNLGMSTILSDHIIKRDINNIHKSIIEFADYYISDFTQMRDIIIAK